MEGVESWLQIKISIFGAVSFEIISKKTRCVRGRNASLFPGMLVDKYVNMKDGIANICPILFVLTLNIYCSIVNVFIVEKVSLNFKQLSKNISLTVVNALFNMNSASRFKFPNLKLFENHKSTILDNHSQTDSNVVTYLT